jgi:hypothetical protein
MLIFVNCKRNQVSSIAVREWCLGDRSSGFTQLPFSYVSFFLLRFSCRGESKDYLDKPFMNRATIFFVSKSASDDRRNGMEKTMRGIFIC